MIPAAKPRVPAIILRILQQLAGDPSGVNILAPDTHCLRPSFDRQTISVLCEQKSANYGGKEDRVRGKQSKSNEYTDQINYSNK